MPTEDETRRELFDLLVASISSRAAALLMTYLPPTGWANLATKDDLAALRSELRGDLAELRGEMAEMRADLRGEIAELRSEMHAQVPKFWAANVATMIGLSGLVFAIASFSG